MKKICLLFNYILFYYKMNSTNNSEDIPLEMQEFVIKNINDLIYGKLTPIKARKIIALICTSMETNVGELICDIVTNEFAADADAGAGPS